MGETKVMARDPVRESKTLNGAVAVGKDYNSDRDSIANSPAK